MRNGITSRSTHGRVRASHGGDAMRAGPDGYKALYEQMAVDRLVTAQEIGLGAVQTGAVIEGGITASKLSIGGMKNGNLLSDAGWEWYGLGDTRYWTIASPWVLSAPSVSSLYFRGRYRLRMQAPAASSAAATSDYVPFGPQAYGTWTAQMVVETPTAGTFEVNILTYDSAKAFISRVNLWTTPDAFAWPGVMSAVVQGATAPVDPDVLATVLPSGTGYIRIEYRGQSFSASNVYVVANSFTYGTLAMLDSSPQHLTNGVTLDAGGIIIYDGKLVFKDQYGVTALTGQGWGAAWEDFETLNVYNGNFLNSNASTNTSDYWTATNGTPFGWDLVTDATCPGGVKWRYTIDSSTASTVNAKLAGGKVPASMMPYGWNSYQLAVSFKWAGSMTRRPKIQAFYTTYDAAGTPSAPTACGSMDYTTMSGNNVLKADQMFAIGPLDRAFSLSIECSALSGSTSGTDYIDIIQVRLSPYAPVVGYTIYPSEVKINDSGKLVLELSSTGADTGMTIGGDTTLFRSAADSLKTDDALEVAGVLTNAGKGIVREWATSSGVNATFTSATDATIISGPLTSENTTDTFRITLTGVGSFRAAADTLTFKFTDNAGTAIATVVVTGPGTAVSGRTWKLVVDFRLATRSATVGNARGMVTLHEGLSGDSDDNVKTYLRSFNTSNNLDNTAFDVKMAYSTANASNTMTVRTATFEHIVG